MGCPDDNVLTEFVDGTLEAGQIGELEGHIDRCPACRSLLAGLARASEPDPGELRHQAYMNGRYVPRRVLGVGGMSVVYEGFDQVLRRRVALKVMAHAPDNVCDRLRREAQALGMLSHPNVVEVFDVEITGGGAFLACELVEGGSLRTWLAKSKRSWNEVLGVIIGAARGLEAAHAVGLLHRDVSPNNILVGEDGRARVADFGLARLPDTTGRINASQSGRRSQDAPHSAPLTGVMGTPAYLAPEVLAGAKASAAADQYGLCSTAAEALEAVAPSGRRLAAARAVRRVLDRGRAHDPAHRFVSIAALRRGLQRAMRPRVTLRLSAGALALGGLLAWVTGPGAPPGGPCDTVAATVAARFDVAALDVAPSVVAAIADRAEQWERARAQTCTSTEQGPLSERTFDLRWACLTAARRELVTLSARLGKQIVRDDPGNLLAAERLPNADACLDDDQLSRRFVVAPAEYRAQVEALQLRRSEAVAARLAGQETTLSQDLEALLADAQALGYEPLIADVLRSRGVFERQRGDIAAAREHLSAAALLAAGSGSDTAAAWAWLDLLALEGSHAMDFDAAEKLKPVVDAALARLGDPDRLVASRAQILAVIHDLRGEYEQADPLYAEVLRLTERVYGRESLTYAGRLGNVGIHNARWGQLDPASAQLHEALAISEALLGADAAALADEISNLAALELQRRDFPTAQALARRALEIRERDLSPDDPRVAVTVAVLGEALSFDNQEAKAIPLLARVISIREGRLGPRHPATIDARYQLAIALARARRFDDAELALAPAVAAIDDPAVSREQRGVVLVEYGRQHLEAQRWPEAVEACQIAVDMLAEPAVPAWLTQAQSCLAAAIEQRPEP